MLLFAATLTDAIINQHSSLRGIAQQLAEVYYIVGAQQLDGYGQECFLAKDERGSEVLIGASLTGRYRMITTCSPYDNHTIKSLRIHLTIGITNF